MDPLGATSKLPAARAWAEGVGLLIWMIGPVTGRGARRLQGDPAGRTECRRDQTIDHGQRRRLTSRLILGP